MNLIQFVQAKTESHNLNIIFEEANNNIVKSTNRVNLKINIVYVYLFGYEKNNVYLVHTVEKISFLINKIRSH